MLNTMIVLKMKNCTYDDWKKAFDADANLPIQLLMFGRSSGNTFSPKSEGGWF